MEGTQNQRRTVRAIRAVDGDLSAPIGVGVEKALRVLAADAAADEWTADIVAEVIGSQSRTAERVAALGRLLSFYGVGSIVPGQIGR